MKNKNVGYLISGISILIFIIIILFNQGLKSIVSETCSHGPSCSMYSTINFQTYLSLSIGALVFLIGLFLIFAKEHEIITIKKVKEKQKSKKINLEGLNKDEKEVIKILQEEKGAIFQKTLMEKLNCGKVKITRILDKLESRELVMRKRRGMNNIVVLIQ